MAKFDASQFFKNASIERGIQRINELLSRVQKKTKLSAVAVHKGSRMGGFMCHSRRKDDLNYKVIRFKEIQDALNFARHDVYFFCWGPYH